MYYNENNLTPSKILKGRIKSRKMHNNLAVNGGESLFKDNQLMTPDQLDNKSTSIHNFGNKFDIGDNYDKPSIINNEDRFEFDGYDFNLEEEHPLADPFAVAIRNIEIRCYEENRQMNRKSNFNNNNNFTTSSNFIK